MQLGAGESRKLILWNYFQDFKFVRVLIASFVDYDEE